MEIRMKKYTKNEINEVVAAFENHDIIAFPTDTVYGVGVKYGNLEDLARLKNAKHRPEEKPIPMMVSKVEQIEKIAHINDYTKAMIQKFMPGALTIVVQLKGDVSREFTNGKDTIAIRMPDDEFVLNVIDELNCPLLVSSANMSGEPTALTMEDALQQLPHIDGIVEGTCKQLMASTIVDCTQNTFKILRPGPITEEMLKNI